MINYDIGIQTLWNVPNYGTFIQAYALQKIVEKISNRDVVQVAHLDQKHFDFYYDYKKYLRSGKKLGRSFLRSLYYKNPDTSDKMRIFSNAYNCIPHTETIASENIDQFKFNKVILGSDILWDYTLEPFNQDKFLFGVPFECEINSYAASFGTVTVGDKYPDYVVRAISKMKCISVRDEKSALIVEDITGSKPPIVLDPTWLWDFSNDENIIEPEDDNYILVYGQDFTESFVDNLIHFAKKRDLKIIALDCNSDNYKWCDKLVHQSELDPFLWVGYFKKAKYIATSTFHGLTFSLIFKKKFAFCKTDFIMAKAGHFLKDLGLFEKFTAQNNSVEEMIDGDWNYKYINAVIDSQRTKSIQFLHHTIF